MNHNIDIGRWFCQRNGKTYRVTLRIDTKLMEDVIYRSIRSAGTTFIEDGAFTVVTRKERKRTCKH